MAVLIVCYNGKAHLAECLPSVLESVDPEIITRVVVVDNASTDGSLPLLRERFPWVESLAAPGNLGFAGGNNFAWAHVQSAHPDVRYVYLLNQDTLAASGFLRAAVDYLEAHPEAGCAQSKIRLHPRTDLLNTVGNRSHFLGFGFTTAYEEPDTGQHDRPASIDFASGAGVLIRASALRELGLFDETLFMYLEDAELSWKFRQVGLDSVYVPESVIYHKYAFRGDYRFYYYLERNRWWLLLVYYRLPTLLLLAPALLLMEAGQLAFAAGKGVLRDKLRSYGFFLQRSNLALLRDRRRAAQRRRTVGDRGTMTRFTGAIDFVGVRGFAVTWIANPIFRGYWAVARRLIFW